MAGRVPKKPLEPLPHVLTEMRYIISALLDDDCRELEVCHTAADLAIPARRDCQIAAGIALVSIHAE
jgi:hypothetical protein